jgi:hypothetical protein
MPPDIKWRAILHLIGMAVKRPVGRPYKPKYKALEWLLLWWVGTLLGGLVLYQIDPQPGLAMLAISGLLWWVGTLVDCYFR